MPSAGPVAIVPDVSRQVAVLNRRAVRRRALVTGSFLFWLYGMGFMFLLPRLLPKPSSDNPVVQEVLDDLIQHEDTLYKVNKELKASKSFLWWMSSSKRERVLALQDRLDQVQYRVKLRRDMAREALVQEGHRIWSYTGLQDTRRLFWETFQSGRKAARDNSIFDSAYHVVGSFFQAWTDDMDSRAVAVLMVARLIVVLLWNYTIGCIISAVIFVCRLPGIIRAYQPTLADATIFFLSSTVGAISVLTTFLALLVGTIFCCLYSTAATFDALSAPASSPLLTAAPARPPAPLLAPPQAPAPAPAPPQDAPMQAGQEQRGREGSPSSTVEAPVSRPDSPLIPLEPEHPLAQD